MPYACVEDWIGNSTRECKDHTLCGECGLIEAICNKNSNVCRINNEFGVVMGELRSKLSLEDFNKLRRIWAKFDEEVYRFREPERTNKH
jgi:hypothetical protein